jgi:hypothetical protein
MTIEEEWKKYCLACFGNISDQQYIDLRRTFYGGASALFFVFMGLLEPGLEPTAGDVERVTMLQNELLRFNQDVTDGKA